VRDTVWFDIVSQFNNADTDSTNGSGKGGVQLDFSKMEQLFAARDKSDKAQSATKEGADGEVPEKSAVQRATVIDPARSQNVGMYYNFFISYRSM
jgi:hypothetical protein